MCSPSTNPKGIFIFMNYDHKSEFGIDNDYDHHVQNINNISYSIIIKTSMSHIILSIKGCYNVYQIATN